MKMPAIAVDEWSWGRERIVWGYAPTHQYTFKVLEPKRGRAGCLSLQYHHRKSETWFTLRGVGWALIIVEGVICTRLLRAGDIQNLETGVVHRLMGVSDDLQVLEPSTPDAHAADKSVPKDVVRLHCVFGREVAAPRNAEEARLVAQAAETTEEAIAAIESGALPVEYNLELLMRHGAFRL